MPPIWRPIPSCVPRTRISSPTRANSAAGTWCRTRRPACSGWNGAPRRARRRRRARAHRGRAVPRISRRAPKHAPLPRNPEPAFRPDGAARPRRQGRPSGKLGAVRAAAACGAAGFSAAELDAYLARQRENGFPAAGHSEQFRAAYRPAYRVVERGFCHFLPVFALTDQLLERRPGPIVLAIDGNCCAGKTSLAALLQRVYGCNALHMDDFFFLRPAQRTPERMRVPGANVDHERFLAEVGAHLRTGKPFSFQRYDCGTQRLCPPVRITPTRLTVVEGSYSMHPSLRRLYDAAVFRGGPADAAGPAARKGERGDARTVPRRVDPAGTGVFRRVRRPGVLYAHARHFLFCITAPQSGRCRFPSALSSGAGCGIMFLNSGFPFPIAKEACPCSPWKFSRRPAGRNSLPPPCAPERTRCTWAWKASMRAARRRTSPHSPCRRSSATAGRAASASMWPQHPALGQRANAAAELIRQIAQSGADALIVQDLAAAALARQICPELPLHASTQMSVHSAAGVQMLERLGFARAILARELSAAEIARIREQSALELELFVHGALCMSVSGQCLMSAMLGGRSGNRGLCAQPCRLAYTAGGREHALSLKDLSLIPHIRQLQALGVRSLKIEGRMKRPECGRRRARLPDGARRRRAGHGRAARRILRSGFYRRVLYGAPHAGHVRLPHKRGRIARKARAVRAFELYRKERPRVGVAMRFTAQNGAPCALEADDGTRRVRAEGPVPRAGAEPRAGPGNRSAQPAEVRGHALLPRTARHAHRRRPVSARVGPKPAARPGPRRADRTACKAACAHVPAPPPAVYPAADPEKRPPCTSRSQIPDSSPRR